MKIKKTNTDNRLILISDNEGKVQIRFRKTGEAHWSTIYTEETDIDKMIDKLTDRLNDK